MPDDPLTLDAEVEVWELPEDDPPDMAPTFPGRNQHQHGDMLHFGLTPAEFVIQDGEIAPLVPPSSSIEEWIRWMHDRLSLLEAGLIEYPLTLNSWILGHPMGTLPFDAWIGSLSFSGSLPIDAIIRAQMVGALNVDAIIRASRSGSLTVDSWVSLFTSGALVLDAIVKAQRTSSLTVDAIIKAQRSGSLTLDSWIAAMAGGGTGDLTLDAIIRATRTGSLTLDSLIRATRTGSLSVDAVIKATRTGSLTLDALVRVTRSGSLTLDALVSVTRTGSITLDAWVYIGCPVPGEFVYGDELWAGCPITTTPPTPADNVIGEMIFGEDGMG